MHTVSYNIIDLLFCCFKTVASNKFHYSFIAMLSLYISYYGTCKCHVCSQFGLLEINNIIVWWVRYPCCWCNQTITFPVFQIWTNSSGCILQLYPTWFKKISLSEFESSSYVAQKSCLGNINFKLVGFLHLNVSIYGSSSTQVMQFLLP